MSNLALGDPPLDLCAPGVGTWGASLSAEGTTDRRAGWLNSYVHSEKLKDPTSELQVTLHDLSSTISEGERKQFEHLQEQCCREFLNVIEAGALKQAKEGKRNKYLKKVNEASEDFCHVALHYQNVFDVLSNTGDYTSVIWGALKILMLYKINNRELQQEVQKHLGDIGEWMTELCAYQYIPQTKAMQNIITATYTLLLKFLAEALKYYKDSRLAQKVKALTRPWKLRFQPIISEIQKCIQAIQRIIQTIVAATIEQLSRGTERIEQAILDSQDLTSQAVEGNFYILRGQKELLDLFRTLAEKSEVKESRECAILRHWPNEIGARLLEEHRCHKVNDDTLLLTDIDEHKLSDALEALFTQLGRVSSADDTRRKRYNPSTINLLEDESPAILNLRWNLAKNPESAQWASSPHSHLLWIEGYQESTAFDWTTRVSLDVQKLAMSVPDTAVLSCFCSDSGVAMSPSLVLQTFIQQLVVQQRSNFSSSKCYQQALSRDRFKQCGDDFFRLWSLFATCIDVSRIKCLFIIMDNIDGLFELSGDDAINHLLHLIAGLAQSRSIVSKILVTSRLNRATHRMRRAAVRLRELVYADYMSVINVPRARQAGSDGVQIRGQYRLSVVGNTELDDDDTLLHEVFAEEIKLKNQVLTSDNSDDDEFIQALVSGTILNDHDSERPEARSDDDFHRSTDDYAAIDTGDWDIDAALDDAESVLDLDSDMEVSQVKNHLLFPQQSLNLQLDEGDDVLRKALEDSGSELDLSDLDAPILPKTSKAQYEEKALLSGDLKSDDVEEINYDDL